MSTALAPRTRDGMPSVAAMLESDVALDRVRIDAAGAIRWAQANGVKLGGPGSLVGLINAARMAADLPLFDIEPGNALSLLKAALAHPTSTRAPEPAAVRQPAARASPDMPTTDGELIDLISDYVGTITGFVSPRLAGYILNLNTGNRPLSGRAVDRFVNLLRNGQWVNTGEPVIISDTGCLNDGQHRLTAIVRSGIGAIMDLRFGIAREAFAATGTGTRRTTGNVLAIAGKPHASMQAAIGRLLVHHKHGRMQQANQQVEGQEVIAILDAEPSIVAVAAMIRALKFKPARTAPFGFALVLASHVASMDQVEAFANLVDSGRAEEDDATRRLHVRLRDAAMAKERMHQVDVAVLTIRAWNAWINSRRIQQIKVMEADRTGPGFPKVVGNG